MIILDIEMFSVAYMDKCKSDSCLYAKFILPT